MDTCGCIVKTMNALQGLPFGFINRSVLQMYGIVVWIHTLQCKFRSLCYKKIHDIVTNLVNYYRYKKML